MSRALAPPEKPTSLSFNVTGNGVSSRLNKPNRFVSTLQRLGPDLHRPPPPKHDPPVCPTDPDRLRSLRGSLGWRLFSAGICDRSLPASNGEASNTQRLMWVRFSSSVSLPFPTSNMSGSFQCPRASVLCQAGLRKPDQRHAIPGWIDITCGPPGIGAQPRTPFPHRVPTHTGRSCTGSGAPSPAAPYSSSRRRPSSTASVSQDRSEPLAS